MRGIMPRILRFYEQECHREPVTAVTGVAIPRTFWNLWGIAKPAVAGA